MKKNQKTRELPLAPIFEKINDYSNLAVAILMNGPLLPKNRDVPCVESLREILNIAKCRSIYHQYTYVDRPLVGEKGKKSLLGETFPTDRLKWNPSWSLIQKIMYAQYSIYRKASYKKKSNVILAESLVKFCFKKAYVARPKLEIKGRLDEVLALFEQSRNQQELYFPNNGILVMRHLRPNHVDVQHEEILKNNSSIIAQKL